MATQRSVSATGSQRLWEARALHAAQAYEEAALLYAEAVEAGGAAYDATVGRVSALVDGGRYDLAETALAAAGARSSAASALAAAASPSAETPSCLDCLTEH